MKNLIFVLAMCISIPCGAVSVEPTTMKSSFEDKGLIKPENPSGVSTVFIDFGLGEFRGQNCLINGGTNRISINLFGGLTFTCTDFIYVSFEHNTYCDIDDDICLNTYAPPLGTDDDEILNYHVTMSVDKGTEFNQTGNLMVSGNCIVDRVSYHQPSTNENKVAMAITMSASCLYSG